jgi:uracil-DNA glycosylase
MLVGDHPRGDECIDGEPFVGASGKLLNGLLEFAGIDRDASYLTNVFTTRPPRNDVTSYFVKPKLAQEIDKRGGHLNTAHGFLKREHHHELARFQRELITTQPKIIVALGPIALWALTGLTKITDYRGVAMMDQTNTFKLVATFHPDSANKDYSLRPIIGCDLQKAVREMDIPGIVRPKRFAHIIENKKDVDTCIEDIFTTRLTAFDVETERRAKQITCMSFAPAVDRAYVFPFWNMNKKDYSHFDEDLELYCWGAISIVLGNPGIIKIAHNATYDITYCQGHGWKVAGKVDDTMLKMHAYQCEWPKSLGFIGSIFCNETHWKTMRVGAVKDRHKANE